MAGPLDGCVAVVAGATRGAGRGIARMLGEAVLTAAHEAAKHTHLAPLVRAAAFAAVEWQIASKAKAS